MAYPSKPVDRALYWRRQLDFSAKVLEPWFKVGRRLLHLYENEAYTNREQIRDSSALGEQNVSRAKPSMVFGWIDQSIANMLSRNPQFRVTGRRKDASEGEIPVAGAVNYWYDETGQIHQDRRCLLDAFLFPFAVKKIGWTSDVVPEGEVRQSDITNAVFDDPEEENLFLGAGTPTRVLREQDHVGHLEKHMEILRDPLIKEEIKNEVIQDHIDEHNQLMDEGQPDAHTDIGIDAPFGIRWNPEDFRIDPLAMDGLKDARWIAFRSVRPIDEVKDNPNYKNTSKLKPGRVEHAPEVSAELGEEDGFAVVTVWEIWARNFPMSSRRRHNILVTIAESGDGEGDNVLLRHEDEWPYDRLDGYPAGLLNFLQGNKTWLQKPLLALAGFDNMQSLLNETLDSILSNVRRQKTVILYDSDVFAEDEIDAAIMAPDQTPIGVPGLASTQGNPVIPLPVPDNPNDRGEFIQVISSLADRAAGTPTPSASKADTATEAAIDERRTSAREGIRADLFEEFQIGTAEIFWRMHTQFRPPMEIEIHPDLPSWSDVDAFTARGAFRFAVDVSSQATAQALERKQWLDLLNLLSGMVEISVSQGQPPPNLAKIAEQLMIRGYGIRNPAELWPAIEQTMGEGGDIQAMLQQAAGGQQPPGAAGPPPGGEGQPPPAGQFPEGGGPLMPQQFNTTAPTAEGQLAESQRI